LDEKARFLQEGSMDVMGLAAEFGLRNGISFPLHGAAGENGILSFITAERASSDLLLESSPILSWMSNYIFEAAIRIVRKGLREGDPQEALTDRETECLFWASEGKTSNEIACILGITERTVNYHLNQVTRKTGSMNRYQAIAKGVSSGILIPNLEQVVVTNYPKILQ
jgi:LuxR family transcriptional activator of bioluminescence operon